MAKGPAGRPGVESEVIAHSDQMRFTLYTLAPGGEIPWHFHSEVTDWYIGREGEVTVEVQSGKSATLAPGEMFQVSGRAVHRVTNNGDSTCRFALVQGLGKYDFNPVAT